MQLVHFPDGPDAPPSFREVSSADRTRLSGPGLRTFRNIADAWKLSEAECIVALGYPGRSIYHSWMKKASEHAPVTLPFDTLVRISAILGIQKALAMLFEEPSQAFQWLTSPHHGTVFAGTAPLSFIVWDGQVGMMTVRWYLDAWRGGEVGTGAAEVSFEPVTEDDVVLL